MKTLVKKSVFGKVHYQKLAEALAQLPDDHPWKVDVAAFIAAVFKVDAPGRFDAKKFFKAGGLK